MKNIWTLIIKTSLPNTAGTKDDIKMLVKTFETFENAKTHLREGLRQYAFSKNSMFDGEGQISKLNEYQFSIAEDDEDVEVDKYLLTSSKISNIQQAFIDVFNGKDTTLKLQKVECCTDWMVGVDWNGETLKMYGNEDGPCNGYDPYIKTNMFDMTKEKNYYLYIDDMFRQDENSSELYVDLVETALE